MVVVAACHHPFAAGSLDCIFIFQCSCPLHVSLYVINFATYLNEREIHPWHLSVLS